MISGSLELGQTVKDAVDAYNSVEKWARTERASFSLLAFPLGPKIRKEPKGVVLIIRYVFQATSYAIMLSVACVLVLSIILFLFALVPW